MAARGSSTFPPSARLHRPSEYAAALRTRRVARGQFFAVHATPGSGEGARLGLIVPKRLARRAVVRNAIKRVVREAFRSQRAQLPARDWVFRLMHPVPPQGLRALKRAVRLDVEALLSQVRTC